MARVGIIGIGHGVFGRRSDASVQELAFAAFRAAWAPMGTWSSLAAEVGMLSTLAGWARTLFSDTRAEAVT